MAARVNALRTSVIAGAVRGALGFCARHGRWGLVAGLVAGLALPDLAQAMRPWLPHMVAGLLAVTAFRIGFHASVRQIGGLSQVLVEVLVLQLVLPLVALALLMLFGVSSTVPALAVVLMLSAPSISGSPNFAVLLGHAPAPAMQVLVVGTALFPLTSLPVFLLLQHGFDVGQMGLGAVLPLIAIIFGACGLGFLGRAILLPAATPEQLRQLDGLGVVAMAVIVVGLMAGIHPLLEGAPQLLLGWLGLVFLANMGLQVLAGQVLSRPAPAYRRAALGIIAGNRNVALFLLALPPGLSDRLLPFIGCYQLPMYLTPLLLGWFYRRLPSGPTPDQGPLRSGKARSAPFR